MSDKKPFLLAALVAFFCLTSQPSAFAQSAEELAKIEKHLSEQKAEAALLERKEAAASNEIEDLRGKLISATSSLQAKQEEQGQLESQLANIEREVAMREVALGDSRARLAALTSALVQLNREPPAIFLLRESSAHDHVHRAIYLRSMLPRLKEEMGTLLKEIDSFETVRKQASTQKRLVAAAQQNLQWQRHNLDQLLQSRQGSLQRTLEQRQAMARQLESLTSEAKDLRQLMEKVSNPSWDKSVGQTIGKSENVKPATLRAGLKMPVVGKILRDYGSKDDFGVTSQGVTLLPSGGSPVVAPQSGKVVFAGPFRGYGQIVIMQHAGGYHSFLAGFGRIDAETGQEVEAGEPLGIMATQGKPELYFEWRKGSEPINPAVQGRG